MKVLLLLNGVGNRKKKRILPFDQTSDTFPQSNVFRDKVFIDLTKIQICPGIINSLFNSTCKASDAIYNTCVMIIIPRCQQIDGYSFYNKKDDQVIVSRQKIQQTPHSPR